MIAGGEFVGAPVFFVGVNDFGRVEAIEGGGDGLAIEGDADHAVVAGHGEGAVEGVLAGFFDGKGEGEFLVGLAAGPPKLSGTAPVGAEAAHDLSFGGSAGDFEDFEGFAFEGAFDGLEWFGLDVACGRLKRCPTLQVLHEVDDTLRLEGVEEAFGHGAEFGDLALGDVGLWQGELDASHHGDFHGGGGFVFDDTAHDATVLHGEEVQLVVFADDGVGIEDVFEEVVQVGAIGAGDVGADVLAFAEEFVALAAGGRVEKLALGEIAFGEGGGGEEGAVFLGAFGEVGFGGVDIAPGGFDEGVDVRVVEGGELADEEGREGGGGDGFLSNGEEEGFRAFFGGGEGVDGIGEFVCGELGERGAEDARCFGVFEGGEGLDGFSTERGGRVGLDELEQRLGGFGVFGLEEHVKGVFAISLGGRELDTEVLKGGFDAHGGFEFE